MEIRRLTFDDIPSVLRLCSLAGWNQTPADIRRLLTLEPDGCFAVCEAGSVVGTTTTTTYGTALAWIGMVLVDPAFRRRGIASHLMTTAIEYLRRQVVATIKLDATPAGQGVYEKLGFVEESRLERWAGEATCGMGDTASTGSWADIAKADFDAFGTDRGALLRSILADSPWPMAVDGIGYAMSRPGSRASYVGPVIAVDIAQARRLLAAALSPLRDTAFIDVNLAYPRAVELVKELGFTKQRDLVRMRLGEDATIGLSRRVFAIAGPEVG